MLIIVCSAGDVPLRIKKIFLTGDFKNPGWENDFGYPDEGFIDDCYSGLRYELLREHIQKLTLGYLDKHTELEGKRKEEVCIVITSEMMNTYEMFGNFKYEDTEYITSSIQNFYEKRLRDTDVIFDNEFLVGRLINILDDDGETAEIILRLSEELTGKGFST